MVNFKTQIKDGKKLVCVIPSIWYEVGVVNGIEVFYDSKHGIAYGFMDNTWKAGQWINGEFVTQEE